MNSKQHPILQLPFTDNMLQQQEDSAVSFCPSFSSYSTDKLVDMAAKVSKELQEESKSQSKSKVLLDEDDVFEFVSIRADLDSGRLFLNGESHQVFPVFNRGLLLNGHSDYDYTRRNEERHVAALKKLFIDDDDDQGRQASSSSSDEDEPVIEPNAIFCIWSPKKNQIEPSPSRCKKSNSTGSSSSSPLSTSSKKWFKFGDLLKRSNSDGKDTFVFLNKTKKSNNVDSKDKKIKSGKAMSAHEAFYVKNRAIKEGDKKKSYLPYRQDLLGLFANYNRFGKTLPPSF